MLLPNLPSFLIGSQFQNILNVYNKISHRTFKDSEARIIPACARFVFFCEKHIFFKYLPGTSIQHDKMQYLFLNGTKENVN